MVTDHPTAPASQTVFLQTSGSVAQWNQIGTAKVQVEVRVLDGGSIRAVAGFDGATAIQFPPYVASGNYPRAVVEISNTGATDELNPGTEPFSWGADFKLDKVNEGRALDNGNNLVERGLFSETAFYKSELDHGKPACSIRGTAGLVVVRAQQPVQPGVWYRMQCIREADRLSVRAVKLSSPEQAISAQKTGTAGNIAIEDSSVPLGVGGKVAQNGAVIRSATDQFNGAVANPFLNIGNLS